MAGKHKKPSFLKALFETRAIAELGLHYATSPLLRYLPAGDHHPVLVLPGLLATDASTKLLRNFIDKKNNHAYPWDMGRNLGQLEHLEKLEDRIKSLRLKHGRKVSLIGWSLGGLFSRLLANRMPDDIRQVITLGSPFMGVRGESNADFAYELVSGQTRGDVSEEVIQLIETTPDVPFTSVYSKGDGIVCWQDCIDPAERHDVQNIEVIGSHLGLGHNPSVLVVIADRLAQEEGYWQPFEFERGINGLVYPQFWKAAAVA